MNCRSFRKYVGAFADGELDTAINVEALEHLNFCESCATKVANIQKMKATLARMFAQERSPALLADRVRGRLREHADGSVVRFRLLQRWVVPFGIAAAVAVVWFASMLTTGGKAGYVSGPKSTVEAQWVNTARMQHQGCTKMGPKHHNRDLPIDSAGIERVLGEKFGFPVLAPDLSSAGFVLLGADTCGLNGIPGAHVIYRHGKDGWFLSVFSLAGLSPIKPTEGFSVGGHSAFVSTDPGFTVISWQESGVTYVFCGKTSISSLEQLSATVGKNR